MGTLSIALLVIVVLILLFIVFPGFRVVQQYERGVIFILGRLSGARGPGIFWVPPMVTRMVKIDLRIVTMQVPPQEIITRDNVTVRVTAVVYFHVVNPENAVTNVVNYIDATMQIGQTTLRNVLGQADLDELLAHRDKINQNLQTIIDDYTERWGVKVTAVEVKDIELPATMQRAMAKQAEAEREKRAKIIHAEGELQASTQLAQAASVMASQSSAMQLRYLQTLTEIAVEKNSTIIFPLPMDIIEPFIKSMNHSTDNYHEQPQVPPMPPMRPLVEHTDRTSTDSAYNGQPVNERPTNPEKGPTAQPDRTQPLAQSAGPVYPSEGR